MFASDSLHLPKNKNQQINMHTNWLSSRVVKFTMAAFIAALASKASAQINISFVESGSNVVATFSGSITNMPDVSKFTAYSGSVGADVGALYTAGFGLDSASYTSSTDYSSAALSGISIDGVVPWVATTGVSSGVTNGVGMNLSGSNLTYYARTITPLDSTVSATVTFYNMSLTDLGFDSNEIAVGSGQFSFINADARLNFQVVNWSATANASAIPEPSTYAAIVGACALGLVAYRRRSKASAVAA